MRSRPRLIFGVHVGSTEGRSVWRFAIGLLIIAYGVLLTADNLHWAPAFRILDRWFLPCAVAFIGIVAFWQTCSSSGRIFWGAVTVVAGLWLADTAAGGRVRLDRWWPLAIVAVGVLMIVRAIESRDGSTATAIPNMPSTEMPGPAPTGAASDAAPSQASGVAFWSGVHRRIASSAFSRADFTAVMGGIEVDLRPATTAGGKAVMDLFVVMGGIEITVPPDWNVVNEALVIMGGVDDKSSGAQGAANTLIIRGVILMGGVEVKT